MQDRFPVGPETDFAYNRMVSMQDPADMENVETGVRLRMLDLCLAALLAAGAATLFYGLLRRRAGIEAVPYARPRGGEREGDFELFIGS